MGTRYLGGYITATEQTPSSSSATGVWDLRTHSKELVAEAWQNPTPAGRALFGGGYESAVVNTIEFVDIATTGNAADFGDLSTATYYGDAVSSSTRGVWGGGFNAAGSYVNELQYVSLGSAGNSQDFGDLEAGNRQPMALSNSTRGVFAGGLNPGYSNIIQYITIASTGNTTDFGDLTASKICCSWSKFIYKRIIYGWLGRRCY